MKTLDTETQKLYDTEKKEIEKFYKKKNNKLLMRGCVSLTPILAPVYLIANLAYHTINPPKEIEDCWNVTSQQKEYQDDAQIMEKYAQKFETKVGSPSKDFLLMQNHYQNLAKEMQPNIDTLKANPVVKEYEKEIKMAGSRINNANGVAGLGIAGFFASFIIASHYMKKRRLALKGLDLRYGVQSETQE